MPNLNYCSRQFASRTRNCAPFVVLWGGCGVFPTLCTAARCAIGDSAPDPGHLARVCPRVFLLIRLIGNFLESVLVCVFFVLLFLLLCRYLLVAFLPELATTLAGLSRPLLN